MLGHSYPMHVEITTERLGLSRATLSPPGMKRSLDEVNSATDLSDDHARTWRCVCMRTNCSAQDRLDIFFAAEERAKCMSQPKPMAWDMAKRCGRFLLAKPRLVLRFEPQTPVDTTLKVDSNHVGCL